MANPSGSGADTSTAGGAAVPLQLGEEPYASGRLLQAKLQPLLDYLVGQGIPATYLRTESYGQYVAYGQQQQFDIALASTGLASLLMEQYQYIPVLAQDSRFNAVVVVRADSHLQSLAQLVNGFILVPEPYDIVSELGRRFFRAQGLEQQLEPRLVEAPKVDRILLSVMNDEFDAGIVASNDLALLAPDLRHHLRVIAQSESVTMRYVLLRKDLPLEQRKRIIAALRDFHQSPEGKRYAEHFDGGRFDPVAQRHLQELQSFRSFGEHIKGAL